MTKQQPPPFMFAALAIACVIVAFRPKPDARERAAGMAEIRAREALEKRRKQAMAEQHTRLLDRDAMWRQPGVSAEWREAVYSRFQSARVPGDYETRTLGRTDFRGVTKIAVLDRRTGDEVQIKGGDVADHQAYGSIRIGFDGVEQPFDFYFRNRQNADHELLDVDGEIDDAGMQVMARLFNSAGVWSSDGKAIVLLRRKPLYFGKGWQSRWQADQQAFIDAKVDASYVSRGIDPDFGKPR